MFKKKLMAGLLAAALVVTMVPGDLKQVSAADTGQTPKEITIDKNDETSINPINTFDADGNPRYGGDPSILVDGDTVYLYVGRDASKTEGYFMPDWECYSTKDLKNWKYERTIMKADKESVTWTSSGTDAWAGQVMKYGNKYYFYYCTWDATSEGKQSIGVATSDNPTGPFTDIGKPLVKGTLTTPETSGWNDIDPTAWIETDSNGVEHRYLCWGNGKVFICELNEDMISVKDINGDGDITFGKQTAKQVNSKEKVDADVVEMLAPSSFTEAPWLYRRSDENGKYYGDYYLFYAYAWREQMAYATISADSDLMSSKWTFKKILMEPAATSNTNHMAVFDFKGKTYFIYHNGSLPGGSGFRRSACIAEVHFNDDGSIEAIPETTIGIHGTASTIYTSAGTVLTHDTFNNSSADTDYPYTDIAVTGKGDAESMDAQWVISAGKADKTKTSYVSIQSENKPGLYLTVNDDKSVTLAQDYAYPVEESASKNQTFKTVEGLADSKGVSFESVSQPGQYLTLIGNNSLCVTNGSSAAASTFYMNEAPTVTPDEGTPSSTNSLKSLSFTGYTTTANTAEKIFSTNVPYETACVNVDITLNDEKGYFTVNGVAGLSGSGASIPMTSLTTTAVLKVFAEDGTATEEYSIVITKDEPKIDPVNMSSSIVYSYNFENTTGDAFAVTKGFPPAAADSPTYKYTDGKNGKAIALDGSYGLELGDANKLGSEYTISFWMKPDELHSNVDPIFTAGTFSPECWLNLTFVRAIWSNNGGYVDDAGTVTYTVNEWQHVACTVKDDKAMLYINGELAASGSIATGIMTAAGSKLYFGLNAWDAIYKGAVDEIVLLNRSITDNEVKAIAYNYANIGNKLNSNTDIGGTVPPIPKANAITAKNFSKTAKSKAQSFSIGATANGAKLTYESNNKKIAVDKNTGKVTIAKNYAGKATITINAAANATYKATTKKITVTVNPAKVTKSSIKATSKKKTITVKYKKAAGAVKYKVEVSTSKKFTKKTTKSVTVKKTSATIKKLKAKTKYYVRVTAIGNNSVKSSAVVAKKTVKTKK